MHDTLKSDYYCALLNVFQAFAVSGPKLPLDAVDCTARTYAPEFGNAPSLPCYFHYSSGKVVDYIASELSRGTKYNWINEVVGKGELICSLEVEFENDVVMLYVFNQRSGVYIL